MTEAADAHRSKAFGFVVTVGLVAALLLAASIPILVGVLVAASIEPLGQLRESVGPASLGHLIWIIPALYVVSSAIDAVVKTLFASSTRTQLVVGALLSWLSILAALSIFVAGPAANMIGAAVATALYMAFARFFGQSAERPDDDHAE